MSPRSSQQNGSATEMFDEDDTFKILLATDNHLGYGEKNPELMQDSFNTFDEILQIGRDREVDMVLLGGDLFHENKPSRLAEHNCMRILKKHVFGDRPVCIELLSDPEDNFGHCDKNHRTVNYLDPNLNIGLPIFSIHGNHDDPAGLGGYCSLDNLHTAGLINYFGRVENLKEITVSPLLFKKGNTKLAIYGMSHVKDERLHRLFREESVRMLRPEEDTDEWFNMLVLHQNRVKRATETSFIPNYFIDAMFKLVFWGHEHDSRLDPETQDIKAGYKYQITQPGSSVATSLAESEVIPKKVGILTVTGTDFNIEEVPLKTTRPILFKTINLAEADHLGLDSISDEKKIQEKLDAYLKFKVEDMIEKDLPGRLTGHPEQPTLPLVRLRVEFENDNHQLSVGRFGNHFHDRVANPSEILKFKRIVKRKGKDGVDFATGAFDSVAGHMAGSSMYDLIERYFREEAAESKQSQLKVLGHKGLTAAVKHCIEKSDKAAIPNIVQKQMNKTIEVLVTDTDVDVDNMDEKIDEFRNERLGRNMTRDQADEAEAAQMLVGMNTTSRSIRGGAGGTPSTRARGRRRKT